MKFLVIGGVVLAIAFLVNVFWPGPKHSEECMTYANNKVGVINAASDYWTETRDACLESYGETP